MDAIPTLRCGTRIKRYLTTPGGRRTVTRRTLNAGLSASSKIPSAIRHAISGGAHRLEEFGDLDLETVAVARQHLRRGENV
jgi:hypothetical protein